MIFRSSHPPLFDWNAWSLRLRSSPGLITEDEFKEEAAKEATNLAFAFWDRMGEFLKRSRTCSELSPDEKTLWIQSGLALTPLMGTCLQYSLDLCLAWALIGEWTSRVLFPVPKGPWPRHGHAGALLQNYQYRSPRIVIADDAWHCTSVQSPRRSYVSGHRDHGRPAETSYHACLWRSQGGDGKISCLDRS